MTSSQDIGPEQVRSSRPAGDVARAAAEYVGPAAPFPLAVRRDLSDPDSRPDSLGGVVRRMPKKTKHAGKGKQHHKGKQQDGDEDQEALSSSSSAAAAPAAAASAVPAAAATGPGSGLERYRESVLNELILRLNGQDYSHEVTKDVAPDEDEAEAGESEEAQAAMEPEAAAEPEAAEAAAEPEAIDAEVFHETWEEVVEVWAGFEDVELLGKVERVDLGKEVAGRYRHNLQLAKNAPGSGKSNGGWASNATRARLQAVTQLANFPGQTEKAKAVFAGGEYTAHHKVSQANLIKLAARAETDGRVEDLKGAIGASGESLLKPLLNFPGNLEAGPRTERRADDPGSSFDANLASGAITPRSSHLDVVDREIERGTFNWDVIVARLKAVKQTQDSTYGGQVSVPQLGQWKATGGRFTRE